MAPELKEPETTISFRTADEIMEAFKGYGVLSTYTDDNDYVDGSSWVTPVSVKGIKGNEGDDNMFIKNEVLKLYYEKKREDIIDKYDEKEQEYFTQNEVVKQFNELIEKFENDLDNLYTSVENFDTDYITVRYDENNYKYKVNTDKLSEEFKKVHIKEREKELKDLEDFVKEVEAQLSLSNDLDYQLEVLTRYDIIDKKTKKMVD